jgi:tRNA (guanine-N7-)-methyltransferase
MERPSNRSYSLRGNRMTRAQSQAMDLYWSEFGVELTSKVNINNLFNDKDKVILEIGSGMGEATAKIAENNPNLGYLAVEMHRPGIGALLLQIVEKKIGNIKILREDATYLLANFITDASLDGIHLLFPDPWPKNRQHKRRIVQSEFVELVANKLKKGGFIHIATDWQPYADWIDARFAANKSFFGGKIDRPTWRVVSKFEEQGLKKRHTVTDFRFERV